MIANLLTMFALIVALMPSAAKPTPMASTPAVDQPAPIVKGTLLDGAPFDLGAWRGKVVLVDFWATWCEPCKLSLPRYAALERKLGAKGFTVLTISVDEDVDILKRFVATTKLGLKVLHDQDQQMVERFAPPKMPTAYLIGRDGKIAWVHESFAIGDETKAEAAVMQALSKAAP